MKVFHRGEKGYEEARCSRVFNHKRPKRYPEAIFLPENTEDVIKAVQYANEHDHKIAIRSGGHSWAVWSVRDTGILLDLQHLNKISLDESTGIVSAGPATKGGSELVPYLKERGLFFNGGHCPTVGIGGFLLQGGQGWNARGWGWSAEYIEAIDVVTADAQLVRANEHEHADLFWAARGAGPGFFGVVTCFHLKTRPYPQALTASTYVYPAEVTEQVLTWFHQMHHTLKTTVELVAVGQTFDFGPGVVVHGLAFEDDFDTAKAALALLELCPVIDKAVVHKTAMPTTLEAECEVQLLNNPEGHRWTVNNAWIEGSPEKLAKLSLDAMIDLPTEKTFTLWYSMAPLRPIPDMAFSLQTDIYMSIYCLWEDEADDKRCSQWVSDQMDTIQPISAGQYLGDSDFTARHLKFMSPENHQKLEKIRTKYDPKNRFHSYLAKTDKAVNQNEWQT